MRALAVDAQSKAAAAAAAAQCQLDRNSAAIAHNALQLLRSAGKCFAKQG